MSLRCVAMASMAGLTGVVQDGSVAALAVGQTSAPAVVGFEGTMPTCAAANVAGSVFASATPAQERVGYEMAKVQEMQASKAANDSEVAFAAKTSAEKIDMAMTDEHARASGVSVAFINDPCVSKPIADVKPITAEVAYL